MEPNETRLIALVNLLTDAFYPTRARTPCSKKPAKKQVAKSSSRAFPD